MSSAAAAASAPLRAAIATFGSAGVPGTAGTAGPGARLVYQPLKIAPLMAASDTRTNTATSQASAPCSVESSARRIPEIRPATQPPITNAKNDEITA